MGTRILSVQAGCEGGALHFGQVPRRTQEPQVAVDRAKKHRVARYDPRPLRLPQDVIVPQGALGSQVHRDDRHHAFGLEVVLAARESILGKAEYVGTIARVGPAIFRHRRGSGIPHAKEAPLESRVRDRKTRQSLFVRAAKANRLQRLNHHSPWRDHLVGALDGLVDRRLVMLVRLVGAIELECFPAGHYDSFSLHGFLLWLCGELRSTSRARFAEGRTGAPSRGAPRACRLPSWSVRARTPSPW